MVKDKLISDIELRITKGKPSDDLELERSLISHWLDIIRDELVFNEIKRDLKAGKGINAAYLERELAKEATTEDDTIEEQDRYYISVSKTPMSIPKDAGIVKVQLTDGTPILPTTIRYLDVMEQLPYASPSFARPLYYRIDKKLYINGLGDNSAEDEYFNVYYIASYSNDEVAEDDDFKISDELLPALLDAVEDIARRERQSDEDLENDGIQ
jgi:hypothetical protein